MTWSPLATETLLALVERDSWLSIDREFVAPGTDDSDPKDRAIDHVLLEAKRRHWIVGERGEGDGSVAWWSTVRLTVDGHRALGQWPPQGREDEPGIWDGGHWGTRA